LNNGHTKGEKVSNEHFVETPMGICTFSSRIELEQTILSFTHCLDVAVSMKDFSTATHIQQSIDTMLTLRDFLPTMVELVEELKTKQTEFDKAVLDKNFVLAGTLHDEVEAMEKKVEEEKQKQKTLENNATLSDSKEENLVSLKAEMNEMKEKYEKSKSEKDYTLVGELHIKLLDMQRKIDKKIVEEEKRKNAEEALAEEQRKKSEEAMAEEKRKNAERALAEEKRKRAEAKSVAQINRNKSEQTVLATKIVKQPAEAKALSASQNNSKIGKTFQSLPFSAKNVGKTTNSVKSTLSNITNKKLVIQRCNQLNNLKNQLRIKVRFQSYDQTNLFSLTKGAPFLISVRCWQAGEVMHHLLLTMAVLWLE